MSAIANDRNNILAGTAVRKVASALSYLALTPSANAFYTKEDGSHNPDVITIKVSAFLVDGPFTFSAIDATLSNVTATTADIAFSSMLGSSAVVTVQAANAGAPISQSALIGVVSDGSSGEGTQGAPGARGASQFYVNGNSWSDIVASAATPNSTPVLGDSVTIYNNTSYALTKRWNGSAWVAMGQVFDGSLFATKSINAAAVNTNGLIVNGAAGNPIVGEGVPLADANVPDSARNSLLVPSIAAAALSGASLFPAVNDTSWTGGTVVDVNETFNGATLMSKALRSAGGTIEPTATRALTIDRTRTYRTRFWARAAAGTNGVLYHALRQYDSSGSGAVSNGGYLWYQPQNVAAHTDWREYDVTWDASGFNVATATVRPSLLMNYGGNAGYWEIRDYLMQDVTDVVRAKAVADIAKAATDIIGSDAYLSRGEKPDVIQRWNTCDNEKASLVPQAASLGVSSTAYVAAHTFLSSYLAAIPNGWSNTTTDSPIVPADWRTAWNAYYDEKQKLINAMAAKAATVSDILNVLDTRTVNTAPNTYAIGTTKEFKDQSVIGIPGAAAGTYCTVETSKGWSDSSGGNAIQWAYVDATTVYKRSAGNSATFWGAWVRDLDRNLYTGDLNATNGATLGTNVSGTMASVKAYANTLGTFSSGGTARTEINDYGIRIYDGSGNLRIKIGQL